MQEKSRCSTYYLYGADLTQPQKHYILKAFFPHLSSAKLDDMFLPNLLSQNHQVAMLCSQIFLLILAFVIMGFLIHNIARYCLKGGRYKSVLFTSFNAMTLLIVLTEITYAILGIILGITLTGFINGIRDMVETADKEDQLFKFAVDTFECWFKLNYADEPLETCAPHAHAP